jgi:hypothetical protein
MICESERLCEKEFRRNPFSRSKYDRYMGRLSSNGTENNAKAETHTRQAFQDNLRPLLPLWEKGLGDEGLQFNYAYLRTN